MDLEGVVIRGSTGIRPDPGSGGGRGPRRSWSAWASSARRSRRRWYLGLDVTVVELFSVPLERVLGPVPGGAIAAASGPRRRDGLRRPGRALRGGRSVRGPRDQERPPDPGGPRRPRRGGGARDRDRGRRAGRRERDRRRYRSPTGVPGVSRSATCADDHPVLGPVRIEHFDKAVKQGEAVSKNILGLLEPLPRRSRTWSDQRRADADGGLRTGWDDMVVRGSIEDAASLAFLLRDGVLRSTVTMDWNRDARRSMPLIAAEVRSSARRWPTLTSTCARSTRRRTRDDPAERLARRLRPGPAAPPAPGAVGWAGRARWRSGAVRRSLLDGCSGERRAAHRRGQVPRPDRGRARHYRGCSLSRS